MPNGFMNRPVVMKFNSTPMSQNFNNFSNSTSNVIMNIDHYSGNESPKVKVSNSLSKESKIITDYFDDKFAQNGKDDINKSLL